MDTIEYAKKRIDIVHKDWKDSLGKKGCTWEFYKGQYLMLREILEPKYRIWSLKSKKEQQLEISENKIKEKNDC